MSEVPARYIQASADGQVMVGREDLFLLLDGTDIIAPEASAERVEGAISRLYAALDSLGEGEE